MAPPRKRSVSIRGHRTSFSVEEPFFEELQRIAGESQKPVSRLIAEIDAVRQEGDNLSSAVRLYVLRDLQLRSGRD